ncbi:MAG: RNA polymerase subunit sigma [Verrucomicrobiae bacterium]|nr:RNA polymerase subunit sigma [Verrucomicrobiae bacterium]
MDRVSPPPPSTLPGTFRCPDGLLSEIYRELRRMAAHHMAGEAHGITLQPTALVHEAWLRFSLSGSDVPYGSREFYAFVSEAMRRILVEAARRRRALKRGGGVEVVEFDDTLGLSEPAADSLLEVEEALQSLEQVDAGAARMIQLRYFVGMNMDEVTVALGISRRSAERTWTFAKAWLRRHLGDRQRDDGAS